MKRYWINTMNRCLITEDGNEPKGEGWREVDEKTYDEYFQRAWKIATNTIWHC